MVNGSSCTVELWIHFEDVLGGLLSSQELEVIVYKRHQHAQWEYDRARLRY